MKASPLSASETIKKLFNIKKKLAGFPLIFQGKIKANRGKLDVVVTLEPKDQILRVYLLQQKDYHFDDGEVFFDNLTASINKEGYSIAECNFHKYGNDEFFSIPLPKAKK